MNQTPDITPEQPVLSPTSEKNNLKIFIKDILETVGLALLLFLVINLVSARVRVEGFSMLPTLDNNQYVLISRLTPQFNPLERGDIIVFRPPMYPEAGWFERMMGFPTVPTEYEDYIKRVIGLPGETVSIKGGELRIDGLLLEEAYIAESPDYQGTWIVPQDFLFVLGDNRNNSSDSHSWSFLPLENVLGKAVLIYWPVSDWMVFPQHQNALAAP